MIPPGLHGTVKTITNEVPGTMEDLEAMFPYLSPGGRFHPAECTSRHRVAIIVPYRDREDHLRTFLMNIHKFLRPQQLDYAIYLGEKLFLLFFFNLLFLRFEVFRRSKVYLSYT
jgi:beta-1,4-galactosyltransferase 1